MTVDPTLLAQLVCPNCHGELEASGNELECTSCHLVYPVSEEGIPIMLIDRARKPA